MAVIQWAISLTVGPGYDDNDCGYDYDDGKSESKNERGDNKDENGIFILIHDPHIYSLPGVTISKS